MKNLSKVFAILLMVTSFMFTSCGTKEVDEEIDNSVTKNGVHVKDSTINLTYGETITFDPLKGLYNPTFNEITKPLNSTDTITYYLGDNIVLKTSGGKLNKQLSFNGSNNIDGSDKVTYKVSYYVNDVFYKDKEVTLTINLIKKVETNTVSLPKTTDVGTITINIEDYDTHVNHLKSTIDFAKLLSDKKIISNDIKLSDLTIDELSYNEFLVNIDDFKNGNVTINKKASQFYGSETTDMKVTYKGNTETYKVEITTGTKLQKVTYNAIVGKELEYNYVNSNMFLTFKKDGGFYLDTKKGSDDTHLKTIKTYKINADDGNLTVEVFYETSGKNATAILTSTDNFASFDFQGITYKKN